MRKGGGMVIETPVLRLPVEWSEPLRVLTDQQAGQLLTMILQYINGKEPDQPEAAILRYTWPFVKSYIDIEYFGE